MQAIINYINRLLCLGAVLFTLAAFGQGTIIVAEKYGVDHTHDHTLKDHGYTYATASAKFPHWAAFCVADGWTQDQFLAQYEITAAHNDAVWSADTYMGWGAVYTRPGRVTQSRVEVIDPHGWYRVNYPLIAALGHYVGGGSNVFGKSVADAQAPKGSTPGTAIVIDHATWMSAKHPERIAMKSSAWGLDYGQVGGIAYSEGCRIEGYRFVGGKGGPIDGAYWSTGLAMADMGEAGSVSYCMAEGFNGPGYCFVGGTPGLFLGLSSFYNAGAGFEFRSTSGLHQSVAIGLSGDDNRGGLIEMTKATGGVAGGSIAFLGCKSEARGVPQRLATLRGSFNVSFTGCWVSAENIAVDAVFDVDGRNPNGGQDWQLSVDGLKHTSNFGAYVKDGGNGKTYTGAGPWKPVSFVLNDAGLFGATRSIAVNGTPTTPPDPGPVDPPPTGTMTATAFASSGSNTPDKAVDGNAGSFWISGTSMSTSGQTFTVKLSAARSVKGVTFGIPTGYLNSYPRQFVVHTSTDGTTWTKRGGTFTGAASSVATWTGVNAQWVRITCTGANPNWWGINEVIVQ